MRINRRTVVKGMIATSAAVAAPHILRAQAAPFKIGLLTVKTGPDETLGTVAQVELKEPAQRAQAEAVLAGFAVPVRFLS